MRKVNAYHHDVSNEYGPKPAFILFQESVVQESVVQESDVQESESYLESDQEDGTKQ